MSASSTSELAAAFVEALARKDFKRVEALLHPQVDLRGLTPSRAWEAASAEEAIDDILRQWFEESDRIDEVVGIEHDDVADRHRVGYRFRGVNDEGPFVVEQQAYLSERDGRIGWMRIVCSGYRPT